MYSHCSSHTHWQAPQAQAQTKACQRVSLPQPREKYEVFTNIFKNQINNVSNFKIFLPLFKEKIKTSQSASSRTGTWATQREKKMKRMTSLI